MERGWVGVRRCWHFGGDQSVWNRDAVLVLHPLIVSHLCLLLQCAGKELKAVVDTGSQHNLMSSACLERLG